MMIDTSAIARELKDPGFTPQQAGARAELCSDLVESDLATKRDIKEPELKFESGFADGRTFT